MTLARSAAVLIALGVFVTILVRIWLRMEGQGQSVSEAVWDMYRFFTIWTNTLIGLALFWLALGRQVSPQMLSGLVLSIVIVAVVYHILLAPLQDFTGMDAVIDAMLHTVLPIGFVLFWVALVPKAGLGFGDIPAWLILPFVYCIFAMARAQFDGVYPYFFLNLGELGILRTVRNIFGLLIAFSAVGALIVLVARLLVRFGVGVEGR